MPPRQQCHTHVFVLVDLLYIAICLWSEEPWRHWFGCMWICSPNDRYLYCCSLPYNKKKVKPRTMGVFWHRWVRRSVIRARTRQKTYNSSAMCTLRMEQFCLLCALKNGARACACVMKSRSEHARLLNYLLTFFDGLSLHILVYVCVRIAILLYICFVVERIVQGYFHSFSHKKMFNNNSFSKFHHQKERAYRLWCCKCAFIV